MDHIDHMDRIDSVDSKVPKSIPEIGNQIPRPGSLPNHYQEVLYWTVIKKTSRVVALQLLALFSFVIFGVIFFGLAVTLGKMPSQGEFSLRDIGVAFSGVVLTILLHELTHGWVMQAFGARPRYGILWKKLMFYATSPGFAYQRNRYIAIALAPFVGISTLVILGMWLLQGTGWVPLLAICGAINAGGAIGDLWITRIVLRYAPAAYVVDEQDGIRLFLQSSRPSNDSPSERETQ